MAPDDHEHAFFGDGRPNFVDSWGIGRTPMTEAEANSISDYICRTHPEIHAFPLDPRSSMSLFLDRATVQHLRDALAGMGDDPRNHGSMIETFDEWLAVADPQDDS